jgi:lipoprotein-releasing system permease protein
MGVELFIGRRYLRSKQKKDLFSLTFLSITGIGLGVMTLIVVIAVITGYKETVKERLLSVTPHIMVQRHLSNISNYRQVMETLEQTPGVKGASPFVTCQAILRSATKTSGTVIQGVDIGTVNQVITFLKATLLTGPGESGKESSRVNGIILGKSLAEELEVKVGNGVQLISAQGVSVFSRSPVARQFRVVGICESGIYDFDKMMSFISISTAQDLVGLQRDEAKSIEIRVTDIYEADRVRENVVRALGPTYWAYDWMERYQGFFSALKLQKTVLFIILTLIVVVAAFNIAGTQFMMVMEKKKDIAILRAMGATEKQIRRIFVFKGMVTGLIGTILGGILGVILCGLLSKYHFIDLPADVYYVTKLQPQLRSFDITSVILATLCICFVAAMYPAHRAAGLNPVDAIRNT